MTDSTATIDDFLAAAAAKQPTPGGGAIAALAGALAATMGEMVLNYSVAKKDLAEHAQHNAHALHQLTNARTMLQRLMVEDQQAYQAFSDAKKAGADAAGMRAIVLACVGVPLAIGTAALQILKIANRVAKTSNRWLHSDLAVCGELAMATVRCAIHNVRVNLPELSAEDRAKYEADCERLHVDAVDQVKRLLTNL
jgi:formiminotetrahydrofolate cyclodeaminase